MQSYEDHTPFNLLHLRDRSCHVLMKYNCTANESDLVIASHLFTCLGVVCSACIHIRRCIDHNFLLTFLVLSYLSFPSLCVCACTSCFYLHSFSFYVHFSH